MFKNGRVFHTRTTDIDNIQVTEYMLDSIGVWNEEYLDNDEGDEGYGLYAIGGPTLELLSKSLEQSGKEAISYSWNTSRNLGYKISNYLNYEDIPIGTVWEHHSGNDYWLAYPLDGFKAWVGLMMSGKPSGDDLHNGPWNFRPVVCLKPDYTVISDKEHPGQYKIVEK